MDKKSKTPDPIPEEFASYEEAAAFWETHDTTDYENAFSDVEVVVELRHQYYEVELEEDIAAALQKRAKQQGKTVGRLANELLRQQVLPAG